MFNYWPISEGILAKRMGAVRILSPRPLQILVHIQLENWDRHTQRHLLFLLSLSTVYWYSQRQQHPKSIKQSLLILRLFEFLFIYSKKIGLLMDFTTYFAILVSHGNGHVFIRSKLFTRLFLKEIYFILPDFSSLTITDYQRPFADAEKK